MCVLHILHWSCLVWFIADFLSCWGRDGGSHESKNPRKGPVLKDTFPPSTVVTAVLAGTGPEDTLGLDLFGWKRFCLWGLCLCIPFHYKPTALRRERLFPPYACSDLSSRFSPAKAFSSQGVKVPYGQVFGSETVITFICGLRDARRYLLYLKNSISAKENTSQWEAELLSASNIFQAFTVLWCLSYILSSGLRS